MIKKIILLTVVLFMLMNCAVAVDSSNWTTADIGYEEFKIPPLYKNPYKSDFNIYMADEDIEVFSIRYVNPGIMSLYGYFIEHSSYVKKVNLSGHDAIHFVSYDRKDNQNISKLWFSAGEEIYYIEWTGKNITSTVKEVVKSASKSSYTHDEFYSILNDEYQNYKIVHSIESQRFDTGTQKSRYAVSSFGTNGYSFGTVWEI